MQLTDAKALKAFDGQRPANATLTVSVVALLLVVIAVADGLTGDAPVGHLYYLPILMSGVKLGRRAAIAVALTSAVLFHVLDRQHLGLHYSEVDILQLVLFVVVALVSSRLAEQSRELHRLATTDDLTGLQNLRAFEAQVRFELEALTNRGREMAMIALDVDRLKSINDAHGHLTGADAVRHVGHIIAARVPQCAAACRYGGDEFAVFLPGSDAAAAWLVAETICAAVRDSSAILAGRTFEQGSLSVSIGLTTGAPSSRDDAAQLAERMFREADRALYDAKAAGRGVVRAQARAAQATGSF